MKEDNKLTFGVNWTFYETHSFINGKKVVIQQANRKIPDSIIITRSALEERDRKMIEAAFKAGMKFQVHNTTKYPSAYEFFIHNTTTPDKQQYIDSQIKNNQPRHNTK